MTTMDFDTAEALGLDGTLRSGEIAQQLARAATVTDDEHRCNWCGLTIWSDKQGAWVDTTDGDGCENNPDGHEPEPTVRDFWQDGRDGTQYLDTTSTPKDSPVSMTVRMVLAPYLRNSEGRTITWEYVAYRTYHAAGTNVPELGPWLEVDRQQGWDSEATALTWAENKAEMIGEDWEPERDAEYAAKVAEVSSIRLEPADVIAIRKALDLVQTVTFTEQRARLAALAERFAAATAHLPA